MKASLISGLALTAAVAALGAISVAHAEGVSPQRIAHQNAVKKCANNLQTTGCIGGINSALGNGVYGSNTGYGYGVLGVYTGSGEGAAIGASTNGAAPALYAQSATDYGAMVAYFVGLTGDYAFFDDLGNLFLEGNVYTAGLCKTGCSQTRHVLSYGARSTAATLDDVGEGSLRGGGAHVALDPAFANAVDLHKPYIVLLTPEGDSGNLYVANRKPTGFDLREAHGGRSSIGFAYRIVAKPYGAKDERLPFHTDPVVARLSARVR